MKPKRKRDAFAAWLSRRETVVKAHWRRKICIGNDVIEPATARRIWRAALRSGAKGRA